MNEPHEGPSLEEAATAAAPVLPTIRMTFPAGKNGKTPHPKVEGEEHLKAIARVAGSAWTVTRVSVPSEHQGATVGLLPVTLTGKEFADPLTLHDRLGAGTYEFACGEKRYVVALATKKAPVEYGEEEVEDMVVATPVGPMRVPKGTVMAPQMNPYAYGTAAGFMPGAPWGAPAPLSATDVAKAVAEANKPILDVFAKVLEKLDGKGDASNAVLLQLKQLEVQAATEERKAREKEAEENRKAKEAELKAMREIESAKAERAAAAQVEIAKAQAESAKETARVQAEAQKESAKAQIESARESAKAQIDAAKERAKHESEFLNRMLEAQGEREDPLETYRKIRDLVAPQAPSEPLAALIAMAPSIVGAVGDELRKIKATPNSVVVVGTDGRPIGTAPAAALPAPVEVPPAPPASTAAEAENAARGRRDLLNAIRTLKDGYEGQRAAEEVGHAIAKGAPLMAAWMRKTQDPLALLKEFDALLARPEFDASEKATAKAARDALATPDGATWTLRVLAAVRATT